MNDTATPNERLVAQAAEAHRLNHSATWNACQHLSCRLARALEVAATHTKRLTAACEAVVECDEWTFADTPPSDWAVALTYHALGREPGEDSGLRQQYGNDWLRDAAGITSNGVQPLTARLLPSRRPSHVTPLEAAAYDVIDDVLDVLQQAEDRAADAADVAEARLSLDRHLATFTALAAKTQAADTPRTKGKDRMSTETLTTSETRIAVVVSHPDFGPPLEMYLDFDLNPLTADSAIKTAARFHERTGYRAIARRVTRSVETTVETITLYDSEIDER